MTILSSLELSTSLSHTRVPAEAVVGGSQVTLLATLQARDIAETRRNPVDICVVLDKV